MILNDTDIIEARELGDLIIEPFDKKCLGSDTYDVRLGEFYYTEHYHDDHSDSAGMYNILDEKRVKEIWKDPIRAETLKECINTTNHIASRTSMINFKDDDRIIWLAPGATLLAHTQEFIGGVKNITTKMFARSSIGRSMIGVCKCAGRGDIGYVNRWTMEITSFSQHHWIPLKVGMRVAQIEFIRTGEKSNQDYISHSGKYQQSRDIKEIMSSWKPDMMLPRLYLDKELLNV